MRGFIITVLLGLTVDVTSGVISIQLIPQYPVINGFVTLSVIGITGEIEYAVWYKGPGQAPQYRILTYFPGSSSSPLVPGPLYNSRFTPFNNGSLQIKDLLTTDGGNYIVLIQSEKQEYTTVTLTVYESVTKPKITGASNQPKENETLTLTCDTSNAVTIRWSRRGSSISSEVKLSGNNKTLTFPSIRLRDSGEYQCEAQNIASKDSSDPYTLTVVYGPDEALIEGPLSVRSGSPNTLLCSVDCSPPPEYQWKVNSAASEERTSKYHISNAKTEDQGRYTCVVRNPVTLHSTTVSVYVTVTAESPVTVLGLAFAIIFGIVLIIIGSICLYRKYMIKRTNGSPENGGEPITIYENTKAAKINEESLYAGLQSRSEDTYTELKI